MDKIVLNIIYNNPVYLDYLRHNPKWYPILENDPNTINDFISSLKKDLKMTTFDRIEDAKKKINFISSMINYFTEKN